MKRHNGIHQNALSATAAVATLFDCSCEFRPKAGYFRFVVCLLGIRQQPFKFADTLLKVHPLFKIHDYFTLRPSL